MRTLLLVTSFCLLAASVVAAGPATSGKDDVSPALMQAIQDLESMQLPGGSSRPQPRRPAKPAEPNEQPAPPSPQPAVDESSPPTRPTSAPADAPAGTQPADGVAREVQEELVNLGAASDAPQEPSPPSQPADPLADLSPEDVRDHETLADRLYHRGDRQAAAKLYQLALDARQEGTDRAWVLLQLGKCYQQEDPARARGFYKRVLVEYPDSRWSRLAEIRQRLTRWQEEYDQIQDDLNGQAGQSGR